MEEEPRKLSLGDRVLSTAVIWRLAQVVLVLAAAYLYFLVKNFGGQLQQARLFFTPHTSYLVQAALVGIAFGLCVGLAIKDFSRGQIELHVDWPALIFNLIGAGVFVALSIALDIATLQNTTIGAGAVKSAVLTDPLLPFAWVGFTLTSLVRAKS